MTGADPPPDSLAADDVCLTDPLLARYATMVEQIKALREDQTRSTDDHDARGEVAT